MTKLHGRSCLADARVRPEWPWHPEFNASGRRRVDWWLEEGTLIEAAGLLGQEAYDARTAEKTQLAAALGIRLVVLTPDDLLLEATRIKVTARAASVAKRRSVGARRATAAPPRRAP